MASTSDAFVPETFWSGGLAEGSLACILLSPESRPGVAMKLRVEGRSIRLTAETAPDLADTIIVDEGVEYQDRSSVVY